ncbi:MAG: hypothetical protein SH868_17615 [Bythopirellula sp.]|nr:hypothetical protein [Bythopirellula sp.]
MKKSVLWDLEDDPQGNVRHIPIDEHLTKEDVENAVVHAIWIGSSRTSGLPILMGPAMDGRILIVVFEEVDEDVIRPVTAWFSED